jgi:hypothetical protein
MLYVIVFGGMAVLIVGIIYFIMWSNQQQTKKVRQEIVNGEREYLVHWPYDDSIQFEKFQGNGSAFHYYKKKLPQIKEVYICWDGILLGDVVFYSWAKHTQGVDLVVESGNPSCIKVKIVYAAGDSNTVAEFKVPIPVGKEQEAEAVIARLYRGEQA